MKILKIEADRHRIRLYTATDGAVRVRESVPTVGAKPGRTLSMEEAAATGGIIEQQRRPNANDRLYSRFTVYCGKEEAAGVR